MQRHNQFIATEYNLVFYKGLPLIDWVINYLDQDGDPYSLEDNNGVEFQIFEEREGRLFLILDQNTGVTVSGNSVVFNTDELDLELGKYYYEISIYQNGYEVLLSYGEAKFI